MPKVSFTAVVDIADHQPAAAESAADGQIAAPDTTAKTEPVPQPNAGTQATPDTANKAAQPDLSAEAVESTPVAFTADMEVAQICPLMTMEYARGILAPSGIRKGWTLGQVADDAPASLKWYRFVCPDADNITKAACQLLLDDLNQREALKKAG